MAPVVEKVLTIEAYDVPAEVEYLQVAFSLVTTDMVVWVVPADRMPEGEPLEIVGGVVSGGGVGVGVGVGVGDGVGVGVPLGVGVGVGVPPPV